MDFVCPKCKAPLAIGEGGVAKCALGHSYDRARAGYYNLLLEASGKMHGDNIEMVRARRDFLDTGAYFRLADAVASLASRYLSGTRVLDIGCGEGYYTNIIEERLRERGARVSAFDISRDAVKYAAKKNPNLSLAVASAYHMPLADGSVDLAVNMFSPLAREEVVRVLRTGGIFILAIPDEDHLMGLKRTAYKTPYKNTPADPALSGFELLGTERISYELTLRGGEIRDLFMMTPYAYRTGKEERERVLSLAELTTEIAFIIFVYRRL